jgi:hypothetical protein
MPHAADLDPLETSANPRAYVPIASSDQALAELHASLRAGQSPILLEGGPGVGKTLLLRIIETRQSRAGWSVSFSPFLHMPPADAVPWLLHVAGAKSAEGASDERLLGALCVRGVPALLIVDEIQSAPPATGERLSRLAQLGRGRLTVLVAGQSGPKLETLRKALGPEEVIVLGESLSSRELRALRDAWLAHPGLDPALRLPSHERDPIVDHADGAPRQLKVELLRCLAHAHIGTSSSRAPWGEPLEERVGTSQAHAAVPLSASGPIPLVSQAPPVASASPAPQVAREPTAALPQPPVIERITPEALVAPESARERGLVAASRERLPEVMVLTRRGWQRAREAAAAARAHGWDSAREAWARCSRVGTSLGSRTLAGVPALSLVLGGAVVGFGVGRLTLAPAEIVTSTPAVSAAPISPPPVRVQVNARPWAMIKVDGVDVGPTPLGHLELTPGVHEFEARFPDGRVLRRRVEIGPTRRLVSLAPR